MCYRCSLHVLVPGSSFCLKLPRVETKVLAQFQVSTWQKPAIKIKIKGPVREEVSQHFRKKNKWMCFLQNTLMKISQRISNSPCQQLKLDPSVERSFCKESFDAAQPQSRRCSVEKKKKKPASASSKMFSLQDFSSLLYWTFKNKKKTKKSRKLKSKLLSNEPLGKFNPTFFWNILLGIEKSDEGCNSSRWAIPLNSCHRLKLFLGGRWSGGRSGGVGDKWTGLEKSGGPDHS